MKSDNTDISTLPVPDDSELFFASFKTLSERHWQIVNLENCWGYQIQQNSKWKPGLTDAELLKFEEEMGFAFPQPLRSFYKVMNGIDKPGINICGNDGSPAKYLPVFYSYPQDLALIKDTINWIFEANSITGDELLPAGISRIFPVHSHRFVLIDIPGNPVLSMYGNDIIYYGDNISKLLIRDIFNYAKIPRRYKSKIEVDTEIKFWFR
ncbi:SMI1/KNR4 family protein [Mucilaginibacter sp. CAU 1740]|uniref:SMI1/KNR4 family protein n=1 Tax=Mucilaginibacter sp. CAU 1740 TaxID=3140365 RepID=UPI00325AE526